MPYQYNLQWQFLSVAAVFLFSPNIYNPMPVRNKYEFKIYQ